MRTQSHLYPISLRQLQSMGWGGVEVEGRRPLKQLGSSGASEAPLQAGAAGVSPRSPSFTSSCPSRHVFLHTQERAGVGVDGERGNAPPSGFPRSTRRSAEAPRPSGCLCQAAVRQRGTHGDASSAEGAHVWPSASWRSGTQRCGSLRVDDRPRTSSPAQASGGSFTPGTKMAFDFS